MCGCEQNSFADFTHLEMLYHKQICTILSAVAAAALQIQGYVLYFHNKLVKKVVTKINSNIYKDEIATGHLVTANTSSAKLKDSYIIRYIHQNTSKVRVVNSNKSRGYASVTEDLDLAKPVCYTKTHTKNSISQVGTDQKCCCFFFQEYTLYI